MKREIVKLCADLFDISPEDLLSSKRRQRITHARMALYAGLRKRGWSYPRIGMFCNRDHSTILAAINRAQKNLETSEDYRVLYRKCLEKIAELNGSTRAVAQ